MTSSTFDVGSSFPVEAPPGARKSRRIGAPDPATPSRPSDPATAATPLRIGKCETIIRSVLVLWMRTVASPSRGAGTSPSSTANGPIAADMLPQFPA